MTMRWVMGWLLISFGACGTPTSSGAKQCARPKNEQVRLGPVTSNKGKKTVSTIEQTRCLQSMNVVKLQRYDVEHKLRFAALDYVGGGTLIVAGVASALLGLPAQRFGAHRRRFTCS